MSIRDHHELTKLMKTFIPRWHGKNGEKYGAIMNSSYETDHCGIRAFSSIVAINGSLCGNHCLEQIINLMDEAAYDPPVKITFAVPGICFHRNPGSRILVVHYEAF